MDSLSASAETALPNLSFEPTLNGMRLARAAPWPIMRLAGQAQCRRSLLNSNVRLLSTAIIIRPAGWKARGALPATSGPATLSARYVTAPNPCGVKSACSFRRQAEKIMRQRCTIRSYAYALLALFLSPVHAQLIAADVDNGALYSVSTQSASLSFIGYTGLLGLSDIAFAPDGTLYGYTNSQSTPTLYSIDPSSGAASMRGPLGIGFVFEGGLAIQSNTIAYATNGNNSTAAQLFRVNLSTGQASVVGVIGGGSRDVDGLAFRSDGKLVGLDRVSNSIILIDPATAAASTLSTVPSTVGGVGALTLFGNDGYYSTSGPGGTAPGSNSLYSFNALTGASLLIGTYNGAALTTGISGLALSPVNEPATLFMLLIGGLGVFVLRSRHPHPKD